jgi:hypothetical protein
MARLLRPSGLIKDGGAQALLAEITLIKVENVSWKQILIIDLNHYQIITWTSLNLDSSLIILGIE